MPKSSLADKSKSSVKKTVRFSDKNINHPYEIDFIELLDKKLHWNHIQAKISINTKEWRQEKLIDQKSVSIPDHLETVRQHFSPTDLPFAITDSDSSGSDDKSTSYQTIRHNIL